VIDNPKRRKSDKWRAKPIKYSFIVLTVIFVIILIGFAKVVHDVQRNSGNIKTLVHENAQRITDVQTSRVESCKTTYDGIRKVFKPFFPAHPTNKQQIENLEKFNTIINGLIKKCVIQTKPKTKSKPKADTNQ
jgi:hypothetical protein